jgi:hypothetical protein
MRRLTAAGLLPERAGQPVKAWAHISLADLLLLDGDSALQDQWTLCRRRHNAHYADIVVMPMWGGELLAAGAGGLAKSA